MIKRETWVYPIILTILCVISSLLPSVAAQQRDLVGYWKFNEGTGLQTQDHSGYGNTGYLNNENMWIHDATDTHLRFWGAEQVTVNHAASLNLDRGVTLMAWIRPSTFVEWMRIVAKSHETGDAPPYVLYGLLFDLDRHIRMQLTINGIEYELDGSTEITTDRDYHVACTYDGNQMKLYVDGQQEPTTLPISGSIDQNTIPVVIGANARDYHFYWGDIDEVRIYNYALTTTEISNIYRGAMGTFSGYITDTLGTPLSGATVTVDRQTTTEIAENITSADGWYSFTLPYDTYQVTITKPGYNTETVSITVDNDMQRTFALTRSNLDPTARIVAPDSGLVNTPLQFDGSQSDDDGWITTYTWDFGDDTTDSGAMPSHSYRDAGTYLVTLTVTDNDGATDSDTLSVRVDLEALTCILIAPENNHEIKHTPTEFKARVLLGPMGVAGASVTFQIDDVPVATVVTNAEGYAISQLQSSLGHHTWNARAEQPGYRSGNSPTQSITILAPTVEWSFYLIINLLVSGIWVIFSLVTYQRQTRQPAS